MVDIIATSPISLTVSGAPGEGAYDQAVANGYTGSQADYYAFLGSVPDYAQQAQDGSTISQQAARASEAAAGVSKTYVSKSAATTDLANIPANAFARVLLDETNGGSSAIYQKQGGALVVVSVDRAFITLPRASGDVTGASDATAINAILAIIGPAGAHVKGASGSAYIINNTLIAPSNVTLDMHGCSVANTVGRVGNLVANAGANTNGLTGFTPVTLTWTNSPPTWRTISVSWPAHGMAVGEYVRLTGADQSEFRGLFRVYSVTDANTLVLLLKRIPTAAPTNTLYGETIQAKRADRNISYVGGIWDYDPTNPGTGGGRAACAIVMDGVQGGVVQNLTVNHAPKFAVMIIGRNFRVSDITASTNSDIVKVYGPSWDGIVEGISGNAGDDNVTVQSYEGPPFTTYQYDWGDCLDITVRGIDTDSAITNNYAVAGVYSSRRALVSGIVFDGVRGMANFTGRGSCEITGTEGVTGGVVSGSATLTVVTINGSLPINVGDPVYAPGVPDGTTITAVPGGGSSSSATGAYTMSAQANADALPGTGNFIAVGGYCRVGSASFLNVGGIGNSLLYMRGGVKASRITFGLAATGRTLATSGQIAAIRGGNDIGELLFPDWTHESTTFTGVGLQILGGAKIEKVVIDKPLYKTAGGFMIAASGLNIKLGDLTVVDGDINIGGSGMSIWRSPAATTFVTPPTLNLVRNVVGGATVGAITGQSVNVNAESNTWNSTAALLSTSTGAAAGSVVNYRSNGRNVLNSGSMLTAANDGNTTHNLYGDDIRAALTTASIGKPNGGHFWNTATASVASITTAGLVDCDGTTWFRRTAQASQHYP